MIAQHTPVMIKVAEKTVHNAAYTTLFFDFAVDYHPGQFIMVWIPGVDEKPYSLSFHSPTRFGITIEAKGIFSRRAVGLSTGDLVGIRGPFGNGFDIISSPHTAVVAGGCGMAPLAPLVARLHPELFFIQGARTREFILFPDRFDVTRHITTDDGSLGYKGLVTDLLAAEIRRRNQEKIPGFDRVYACGPEMMMHAVFTLCETHGIDCRVSLERYMRCGFGVCGACVCSDRVVCKDGPVFASEQLRKMPDFNRTALLKSGRAVPVTEYASWRCQ
ncbi:MAG TPA: dihydroorotate dehydrogenase electron transfer subunit [Desulfotignum sp.]|jgi:dihydroorotate dehydrogenase electron transfer subunit|nr:dihydroorotate dehydrogenase electron transfer subunit [Desulfotignum sp.]